MMVQLNSWHRCLVRQNLKVKPLTCLWIALIFISSARNTSLQSEVPIQRKRRVVQLGRKSRWSYQHHQQLLLALPDMWTRFQFAPQPTPIPPAVTRPPQSARSRTPAPPSHPPWQLQFSSSSGTAKERRKRIRYNGSSWTIAETTATVSAWWGGLFAGTWTGVQCKSWHGWIRQCNATNSWYCPWSSWRTTSTKWNMGPFDWACWKRRINRIANFR